MTRLRLYLIILDLLLVCQLINLSIGLSFKISLLTELFTRVLSYIGILISGFVFFLTLLIAKQIVTVKWPDEVLAANA
jgi:hypothetical protein